LVFGALRGRRIIWITLRPPEYRAVQDRDSLFGRQFGRIRDVVQGPDGYLYFATNNLDGRGTPGEGDDLILRIVPVRGSLSYLPQSQVDRG
ncbi:MAG: PQQ-dependent sugar dehydrogenase, partial [Chloroflexi bacterium]|nr:PQQ-dependent sugar dehydrogenase [Chloroflexota bacterium]